VRSSLQSNVATASSVRAKASAGRPIRIKAKAEPRRKLIRAGGSAWPGQFRPVSPQELRVQVINIGVSASVSPHHPRFIRPTFKTLIRRQTAALRNCSRGRARLTAVGRGECVRTKLFWMPRRASSRPNRKRAADPPS